VKKNSFCENKELLTFFEKKGAATLAGKAKKLEILACVTSFKQGFLHFAKTKKFLPSFQKSCAAAQVECKRSFFFCVT